MREAASIYDLAQVGGSSAVDHGSLDTAVPWCPKLGAVFFEYRVQREGPAAALLEQRSAPRGTVLQRVRDLIVAGVGLLDLARGIVVCCLRLRYQVAASGVGVRAR